MNKKYVVGRLDEALYVFDTLADAEEMILAIREEESYHDFLHSIFLMGLDGYIKHILPQVKWCPYNHWIKEVLYFN